MVLPDTADCLLTFFCDRCGQPLLLEGPASAGLRVECPTCRATVPVPRRRCQSAAAPSWFAMVRGAQVGPMTQGPLEQLIRSRRGDGQDLRLVRGHGRVAAGGGPARSGPAAPGCHQAAKAGQHRRPLSALLRPGPGRVPADGLPCGGADARRDPASQDRAAEHHHHHHPGAVAPRRGAGGGRPGRRRARHRLHPPESLLGRWPWRCSWSLALPVGGPLRAVQPSSPAARGLAGGRGHRRHGEGAGLLRQGRPGPEEPPPREHPASGAAREPPAKPKPAPVAKPAAAACARGRSRSPRPRPRRS